MKKVLLLCCLPLMLSANCLASDRAVLSGYIPGLLPGDSVLLIVWKDLISERKAMNLPHERYACVPVNDRFTFKVPSSKNPSYFSIAIQNLARKTAYGSLITLVSFSLLHGGDSSEFVFDSIRVKRVVKTATNDFVDYKPGEIVSVTGSHEVLFECQKAVSEAKVLFYRQYKYPPVPPMSQGRTPELVEAYFRDETDQAMKAQLTALERFKNRLPPHDYASLYADLVCYWWGFKFRYLKNAIEDPRHEVLSEKQRKNQDSAFRDYYYRYLRLPAIVQPSLSKDFAIMLHQKVQLQHWAENSKEPFSDFLYKSFDGNTRERVITFHLVERFEETDKPELLMARTLRVAKDGYCRAILAFLSAKSKGAQSFDGGLADTKGNMVGMSEYRGKIVMLDLWYTGCSNCAGFYRDVLSKVEKRFQGNKDVVFISVSIDADKRSWINSVLSNRYTSGNQSNVVNLYTGGKGVEHAIIKHYNPPGYPFSLLIDKDGRIVSNSEETLRDLPKLTALIESLL